MPNDSEDLYGDAQPSKTTSDQPDEKGGADDGSSTSILPRSFFAGKDLKVGDKCDVTITAIHENDVEVEPCDSSDKDDEKEPDEDAQPDEGSEDQAPAPMASGSDDDGSMSSMMQ